VFQVIDFTTENFFCLMDDAGETRDDLKFTELCTPAKVDDVKTMVTSAEENGQDVVVSIKQLPILYVILVFRDGLV